MEIAVIGDEEFLLGFRLAGIRKVVSVDDQAGHQAIVCQLVPDVIGMPP